TLEALFERHVEPLEDHKVVLDLVADRRRDELDIVALARRVERDDVGVSLHALEKLLLDLEAHAVFVDDALLKNLDDDVATEVGLRLEPALFAEIRLGESTAAHLDGQATRIEHERVRARANDVRRRRAHVAR